MTKLEEIIAADLKVHEHSWFLENNGTSSTYIWDTKCAFFAKLCNTKPYFWGLVALVKVGTQDNMRMYYDNKVKNPPNFYENLDIKSVQTDC